MHVAVIGATGFLGRRLVPGLTAEGYSVTMIARRPPHVIPPGATFRSCDAADAARLVRTLEGASHVVNAVSGSPACIRSAASAVRALCAGDAPPRRVVHVSSLAIFRQMRGMLHEETQPAPPAWHSYAVAKWRAEQIIGAAPHAACRCAILRPGCLYGSGAPLWSDRIGRLLLGGRLGWLGRAGSGRCNLVHVDDMAQAVLRALQGPDHVAGIHHVVAPEEITWNGYFGLFAARLGLPPLAEMGAWRMSVEKWLVAPASHLRHRVSGHEADYLTPAMLRVFRNRALAVTRQTALTGPEGFRPLHNAMAEVAGNLLKQVKAGTVPSFANAAWADLS